MVATNPLNQFRTLREAAVLLGGEHKLSEFLDIDLWLVSRWLQGLGQPSDFVFERCVELIASGTLQRGQTPLKADPVEGGIASIG